MHASMPPKRTSRRPRGYPPEPQGRGEVGSADGEASPPLALPGLTIVNPGEARRGCPPGPHVTIVTVVLLIFNH